jgi:hypothetical protein
VGDEIAAPKTCILLHHARSPQPPAPAAPAPRRAAPQVVSGKLHGSLPPSFGAFHELEHLEVSGKLQGALPAEWRGMQRLKTLSL